MFINMATWGEFVMKILYLVILTSSKLVRCDRSLRVLNHDAQNIVMKQSLNAFVNYGDLFSEESSRDSHHVVKREVQNADPKCTKHQAKLNGTLNIDGFNYSKTLDDSSESLSLVWSSDSVILAVTTEEHFIFASPSNEYLSTDGGKSFKTINDQINKAQIKTGNGLQKHPFDPKRVYLVAHDTKHENGGKSIMYYTDTGGQDSFKQVNLPCVLTSSLIFHPNEKSSQYVLILCSDEKLYASVDYGESWPGSPISTDVISVKWDPVDPSGKTIYIAQRIPSDEFTIASLFGIKSQSRDNDLRKTTDLGSNWDTIHKHVYSFGVQGRFVFVSIFLSAESEEKGNRIMEVSSDAGAIWNEVQLPSIEPDRFYAIVEMSDDIVFVHVDEKGNTGYGTLYVSDATGIVFSKSLERHLYPNFIDLTDFYRVRSMRGVYLASQMLGDQSIRTVISFDRGGEWKPINRPAGTECKDESKDCYLQIHNLYSAKRGLQISPPLSVESAKGLILVHGHVAEALQMTDPDVFLSTDGGYTWKMVLKGPHHYQILDQGGLIVAVPLVVFPKKLYFSVDEGNCWLEYQFTSEDQTLTGLLTAPDNTEMSVAIWGYRKLDRKWTVNLVNFDKIITEPCGDSDYETWTPHGSNGASGCLLGQKETYVKIKRDSWCHNRAGKLKLASQTSSAHCPCTKADYDCDYGYYREVSSDTCKLDPMFKGKHIDICKRGHKEQIVKIGYHKVPGDVCVGDPFQEPPDKYKDLGEECKTGDKSLLMGQIKSDFLPTSQDSPKVRGSIAILITVMTVLVLAGVLLLAFVTRKTIFKRRTTSYRYSQLNVGDYDQSLENAVATHTSLYDDNSDEEAQPITSQNRFVTQVPAGLQNGVLPKFDKYPKTSELTPAVNFSSRGSASSQQPDYNSTAVGNDDTRDTKPLVKSYHDDSDVDMLD